jgi:hypothetical protein
VPSVKDVLGTYPRRGTHECVRHASSEGYTGAYEEARGAMRLIPAVNHWKKAAVRGCLLTFEMSVCPIRVGIADRDQAEFPPVGNVDVDRFGGVAPGHLAAVKK